MWTHDVAAHAAAQQHLEGQVGIKFCFSVDRISSCATMRIGGLHICLLQVPSKGVRNHHA